jgi:phosphatidylserine/phosphatidylglycerophosphate/cardiolipin synthase-like enzyme
MNDIKGWSRMKSLLLILLFVIPCLIGSLPSDARSRHRKNSAAQELVDQALQKVDEAMVAPPQDQETCFSPEEPCAVKLRKFIASARQSVDMAIYDINEESIVHELLTQSKKIQVRIVVDRKQAKGNHSSVPLLVKAGAQVRFGKQRGIMHNKFTIVDGKMVQLGSFNYTHHASKANNENQIYLANPKIVERFQKRFEKLWAKADPVE